MKPKISTRRLCPSRSVAQAIYSNIEYASLVDVDGIGEIWVLPCTAEINLTFVFQGNKYPIHPLDVNFNGSIPDIIDGYGNPACVGAVSTALPLPRLK